MHARTKATLLPLTASLLILALPSAAAAQRYVDLGRGYPQGVSDDGTVVAGSGFNGPYRWTQAGGHTPLTQGTSEAVTGMSGDGNAIVGDSSQTGMQEAARWSSFGGWISLGALPGGSCGSSSSGWGISRDGTTVVGLGWESCRGRAFRWTAATGMVQLATQGGRARANCVSGDGMVVGGWDADPTTGVWRAAMWDAAGTQSLVLPSVPENQKGAGHVWDINHDGTVIVGESNDQGGAQFFRWTATGGLLKIAPGAAYSTNDDGTLIGGTAGSFLPLPGGSAASAFLWTPEDGQVSVESFLANQGVTPTRTIPITGVWDISPDGKYIVGQHGHFTALNDYGFLAELPDGLVYGRSEPGNTLDLSGTGSSQIGQTFTARTANLTLGASWTLITTGSTKFPFLGGTLLVNVGGPLLVIPAAATGGTADVDLPIPNNPRLVGGSLYLQSLAPDTGATGWALSNGMKVTIRS